MSLLSARTLSISIGAKPICRHLDFTLAPGECWGLLGGNGIGKTTLLQTLAGLKAPEQGRITIAGKDLNDWKRKRLAQKLGILFQDSQDMFPASVIETALTGRHPYLPFWSNEGSGDIEMAVKALSDVALDAMQQRLVNTLSGGERRRLAIATLLVQDPLIWLLDEPANHLDVHHQITLLELIINRVETINGGLLMVLHDVNLVTRFCTHAMLMIDADIIICGPVEEVVTIENLQRLYRHPMDQVHHNEKYLFFPS